MRSLLLIYLLMLSSCHLIGKKKNSALRGVESIGEQSSCQNVSELWIENFKTFAQHHKVMNECMDSLVSSYKDELELEQKDIDEKTYSNYSNLCVNEIQKYITEKRIKLQADDNENKKTITELFMALQNKCLGVKEFENQKKLVAYLIESEKVLSTEKWRTGLFIFPHLPMNNRGAQVFEKLRPKKDSLDLEKRFEFYSLCRRTADAGIAQYERLQKQSFAFEKENCSDPTKNWDRNMPNPVKVWTCDSPCRYSGSPCYKCQITGTKDASMTCATEIGARTSIKNWCDHTIGENCNKITCQTVDQDDVKLGKRLINSRWVEESEAETGGKTCLVSESTSTTEFSTELAGSMKLWFGADLSTPFGGVEAGASLTTEKSKKFKISGSLTSAFNICSASFQPWNLRKDGGKVADHSSHFTCTANFNRFTMDSDTLATEVQVSVKTKSPTIRVGAAGETEIAETAKTTGTKSIAWMSRPISAAGATPDVLRATCQQMVNHWKSHSLQAWLAEPGNDVYFLARKIGGIQKGFCTEDTDCVSTLYNGTNKYVGKIYRCIKRRGSASGTCRLRSTGRWVGRDNRWCGERCETGIEFLGGIGGSSEPSCDVRGGFRCLTTTVPYDGWYWAWQDPKKLTKKVRQCVPAKYPTRFGGRNRCARQPGINGD